jgi:hypothetical protein
MLNLKKFLVYPAGLSMGTVSDMTYIKMILIFSGDICKHFIDNTLYSSFFIISNVFYKPPEENIQRSQVWENEGVREWIPPPSYPTIRKFPFQKGANMTEVRWCAI